LDMVAAYRVRLEKLSFLYMKIPEAVYFGERWNARTHNSFKIWPWGENFI